MQTVSLLKKLSVTYSVYSTVFSKYSSKLALHSEGGYIYVNYETNGDDPNGQSNVQ